MAIGFRLAGITLGGAFAQDLSLSPSVPQHVDQSGAVDVAPAAGGVPASCDVQLTVNSAILSVDSVRTETPGCRLQLTTTDLPESLQQLDMHVACRPDAENDLGSPGLVRLQVTARAAGSTTLTVTRCALSTKADCSPPRPLAVSIAP